MKTYYYLRLCDPESYLPLEEYIGQEGVISSRDNLDELLIFDTRDAAGEYLDVHRHEHPNRLIQISHHLGRDKADQTPGVIKIRKPKL